MSSGNINELYGFAGMGEVELSTDDTIQLVCTDDLGSTLTFNEFQVDATPKFNVLGF